MHMRRRLVFAAPALMVAPAASAQAFPQRAMRVVMPSAAGTSSDIQARLLGERMATRLGRPVILGNRAGAGGTVGAEFLARAAPNGHTLLLGPNGPPKNAPVRQARPSYNPAADFAPVSVVSRSPVTLAVRADSPWHSVADLLQAAAGVRLNHLPCRGSSRSAPDFLANATSAGSATP